MMNSVHPKSEHLERWLGANEVHNLSVNFRDWYGPPVAVSGVPGAVYIGKGGDYFGKINAGAEVSAIERAQHILREDSRRKYRRFSESQRGSFSSYSALVAAATGGKAIRMSYNKVGTAPTATLGAIDLWTCGNVPAAGAAGAAAPGGTAMTNSTSGNLGFVNAVVNANTSHFVNAWITSSVMNSLLLYDRLLSVAKTMNSTGTEAVTGTFSRYQSGTATDPDYVGGNFCFPSVPTTLLPATAHNWTVCQYTDQGGSTAQSFASIAGISACALHQIDLLLGQWFMPLAAGDVGVKALTQMQCSALVATGTIDFVVGHPIATLPAPAANLVCNIDGVTTAFNLVTVFDNACLALMELPKNGTAATTYSGQVTTVSE